MLLQSLDAAQKVNVAGRKNLEAHNHRRGADELSDRAIVASKFQSF